MHRRIRSTTAMKRNERLALTIDWGILGHIAVFDDGVRRILGFLWTSEGKFQGELHVYGRAGQWTPCRRIRHHNGDWMDIGQLCFCMSVRMGAA
jgi:hypothetical protein